MFGIALVIGVGTKIAASVMCFVIPRAHAPRTVADKCELSIKLLVGGLILAKVIMLLGEFINLFKGGGDFGSKLSACISGLVSTIKSLARDGGLYLVPALAGSMLLIGNVMKRR